MADGGGTGTSSPASDDGIKGVMTENLLDQLRVSERRGGAVSVCDAPRSFLCYPPVQTIIV